VINTLAERAMDTETQAEVIKMISTSVNSDYYASVSLRKMVQKQNLTDAAFKQLVETAGNMSSDHYASEVLKDAVRRSSSKQQLIDICGVTSNISSDHYQHVVLLEVANKINPGDNDLKEAYRRAAKNIRSETYYGRVLRAID
jgi:hypothetical protein